MNNERNRLVIVKDYTEDTVEIYGYGYYEGNFVPGDDMEPTPCGLACEMSINLGHPVQRVRLDNNQVVWEYEGWWITEELFEKKFKHFKIKRVNIDDERADYNNQWGQ